MAGSPLEGECGWDPEQSLRTGFGQDTSSHITSREERPHAGRKLSVAPSGGSVLSIKYETELCSESDCEQPVPSGSLCPLGYNGLIISFTVTTKDNL